MPKTKVVKTRDRKKKTRTPISKNTEDIRRQRFARLFHQLEKGFHLNAFKTVNQLLFTDPQDTIAKETKAKLLVSLDRHHEALELLLSQQGKELDSPEMRLVQSYCLYKTSDITGAWNLLSNINEELDPSGNRIKTILEAQILSRLERYEEAKDHYEDLLVDSDPTHPEYQDLSVNLANVRRRLQFETIAAPSLLTSIDLERLESTPITSSFFHSHPNFRPTKSIRATDASVPSQPTKTTSTPKTQKPLDPSRPAPDPERWLPRKKRSDYCPPQRQQTKEVPAPKTRKPKEKSGNTQGSMNEPEKNSSVKLDKGTKGKRRIKR